MKTIPELAAQLLGQMNPIIKSPASQIADDVQTFPEWLFGIDGSGRDAIEADSLYIVAPWETCAPVPRNTRQQRL